jgi:hypothetical protein
MKSKKLFIVISMLILAGAPAFIACPTALDDGGSKTGAITGTITLTDVPSPAPKVSIHVEGHGDEYYNSWHSRELGSVNFLNTGAVSNASWSIPIHEDRGFFPSIGSFNLFVDIESADGFGWFFIDIPVTPYINSVNDNVGSLGTVSINFITLSGTIYVTLYGNPVPNVSIDVYTKDEWIGDLVGGAFITPSAASASWSIPIPVPDSPMQVEFYVNGYSDDWKMLFFKECARTPAVLMNVYDQNVSGININLENIEKNFLTERKYPPQFQ